MKRARLLDTCALTVLTSFAAATAAQAQAPTEQASTQTPPAAQPGDNPVGLEDIIVTAQRREANLQSVPVAVTAISADSAAALGIRNTTDIQVSAPAINWGASIGGANISVRGISGTGSAGDESANAIYVDGVYNPVGASLLFSLNNIDRIEIDKGPQGTLFGRNASGGAVQIFTRDPSQTPSMDASVTVGNYRTTEAQAYVTGGITNTLAADLAVFYANQDRGWGRNVTNGQQAYLGRNYSLRTKWKWTPDAATTVVGIYSHNHVQAPALNGGTQILPGENKPYVGFYNVNLNFTQVQTANQDNASLNIRRDLGFATVASITAYDYVDQPLLIDADFSPVPAVATLPDYRTYARTWTQELQLLSSPTSRVDWVLGFYYYWSRNYRLQSLGGLAFAATPGTPGRQLSLGDSPAKSYSVYGQATVPLFDNTTRITGGLRYTIDEREITGFSARNGVTLATVDQSNTDKKLTWRASLNHDLTDNVLGYVSATRGFKSGFFNISNPTNPAVRPQVVDAYEIGLKTQLFDRRVRFNTSAFYYDFNNIQVRRNIVTGPIFLNAAKGRIKGIDVDFQARPARNFELQGGMTYLDGKYTNFPGAPYFGINPTGGILQLADQNARGNRLIRSPKWAASIGGQYTVDLASAGKIVLAANYYYNDGFFFDPQNRIAQNSYHIVNSTLTWAPTDALSVQLWAKNITKERYLTQVDITFPTGDNYFPAPPRTYGATLRSHF